MHGCHLCDHLHYITLLRLRWLVSESYMAQTHHQWQSTLLIPCYKYIPPKVVLSIHWKTHYTILQLSSDIINQSLNYCRKAALRACTVQQQITKPGRRVLCWKDIHVFWYGTDKTEIAKGTKQTSLLAATAAAAANFIG